jgi:hypothetical protein
MSHGDRNAALLIASLISVLGTLLSCIYWMIK